MSCLWHHFWPTGLQWYRKLTIFLLSAPGHIHSSICWSECRGGSESQQGQTTLRVLVGGEAVILNVESFQTASSCREGYYSRKLPGTQSFVHAGLKIVIPVKLQAKSYFSLDRRGTSVAMKLIFGTYTQFGFHIAVFALYFPSKRAQ